MVAHSPATDRHQGPRVITCPAESVGRCDLHTPARHIHDCGLDNDHAGAHECACGHQWMEVDASERTRTSLAPDGNPGHARCEGLHRDRAYAVIAERQQRLEDDERNMRAARRQLELFMDDGIRERITVALALLDENVESRSEAWFDFTEQRGQ